MVLHTWLCTAVCSDAAMALYLPAQGGTSSLLSGSALHPMLTPSCPRPLSPSRPCQHTCWPCNCGDNHRALSPLVPWSSFPCYLIQNLTNPKPKSIGLWWELGQAQLVFPFLSYLITFLISAGLIIYSTITTIPREIKKGIRLRISKQTKNSCISENV